jgi:hypothetical protein
VRVFVGPTFAVVRDMGRKIACLFAVSILSACVGPGQHVRGGRHGGFGHHHHRGPVGGLLAVLQGVALIADVAASVSTTQAALDSSQRSVVVAPPPEPVRALPAYFQGRVLLTSPRAILSELRLGVRSVASGALVAIFNSDTVGRFSFPVPPPGDYTLVAIDPEYEGEMSFASNGRTAFPLELSIARREPRQPAP